MDLYNHTSPLFTQWVVSNKLLSENFVVIDIGVQGGEHPRWAYLGDYAEVHGFDPIAEVIEDLRTSASGKKGRTYHNLALGDEDGTRRFFVSSNRFGSSFYSADTEAEPRDVSIHRLDTLFQQGIIPRPDYIKLDCEGFEGDILRGATHYLAVSDIICVTSETNFSVSSVYPKTHFQYINDILVDYRLLVYDWNLVRGATPEYLAALAQRPWPEPDALSEAPRLDVGRPTTCDVVFCRDLPGEARNPQIDPTSGSTTLPSVDTIIKSMINFELHGLMDCALELAIVFRDTLANRLDVERAIELLMAPPPHARNTADVTACLKMIAELRARVAELEHEKRQSSLPGTSYNPISPQLRQIIRGAIAKRMAHKIGTWLRG